MGRRRAERSGSGAPKSGAERRAPQHGARRKRGTRHIHVALMQPCRACFTQASQRQEQTATLPKLEQIRISSATSTACECSTFLCTRLHRDSDRHKPLINSYSWYTLFGRIMSDKMFPLVVTSAERTNVESKPPGCHCWSRYVSRARP